MPTINQLLRELPPYNGNECMINEEQDIRDIIKEVLQAHEIFATDYDTIASSFAASSTRNISKKIFDFCRSHLPYEAESEHLQTTRSPSGILSIAAIGGSCDCKHYAGFAAGILDGLCRLGYNIDWTYRFASYDSDNSSPGHVFVVVHDYGSEIWIDPAPLELEENGGQFVERNFNDRLARPYFFTDKKPDMSLLRLSGGFISESTYNRNSIDSSGGKCGCGCSSMNGLFDNIFHPADVVYSGNNPQTKAIDSLYRKYIADNADCITDVFAGGVQYLVDGLPLIFPGPSNGSIPVPNTLQVVYPTTYKGMNIPDGLPRPIAVGARLVILPKRDLSLLTADNNFWLCFLTSVMAPLVISYSVGDPQTVWLNRRLDRSGSADTNFGHAIYFDMDMSDVVDYITNMPTKVPITAAKPDGVQYVGIGGEEIVIPPRRDFATIEEYQNTPPPPLPPFAVKYPSTYLGKVLPPGLPKPVYYNGQIQLAPKGFDWNVLKADNFFWLSFLTSVMYQLVQGYSQFPYGDNGNQLADRILYDQDESDEVADYLFPPESKTFVGKVFEAIGNIVQDVAHFVIRFVGAIPRTAFLQLVRLNIHDFAKSMFDEIQTQDGLDKVKNKWFDIGGTWGDLHAAIDDGHLKKSILGIRMRIGVTGVDDVAAFLAAAAPVIALMATFLNKNPEAKAAIEKAVGAMNVMLNAAGYDPIDLASILGGKPVIITDPVTGEQHTVIPPGAGETKGFFSTIGDTIKAHPLESMLIGGGVAFAGYSLVKHKKRTA
jgi:hypothetical protein